MARKDKIASSGNQPVLTLVGTPAEVRAAARAAQAAQAAETTAAAARSEGSGHAEGIFSDSRSGRDRREEGPQVDDPRRQNAERRSSKPQSAWWLRRDYVESHHFVQKGGVAPGMHGDDPTTEG